MDVTELFFFGGIAEKAADLSDTRYQRNRYLETDPWYPTKVFRVKEYFGGPNTFVWWAKYF